MDTISPTQITTYLQCPRKFAFRYIQRAPAEFKPSGLAFGSAVHGALEMFHRRLLDGDRVQPEEIVSAFLTDFAAEEAGDLRFKDGQDAQAMRALGEALVRLYVEEHADLKVVAAEWPFQVPLHDPVTGEVLGPDLRGVFDLLLPDDTLVEIKTAARAYDENTLARNLQLSAYAYAYRVAFKRDPAIRVVALLKQKKPRIERYEARRSETDDAWFVHLASEVARGIQAEAFPPNPGWPCGDCEYQESCRAWRGGMTSTVPADGRRHLPVVQAAAP